MAEQHQATEFFLEIIQRFGARKPNPADRMMWFAQKAWAEKRRSDAYDLARDALGYGLGTDFEVYDMVGNFDMITATEEGELPAVDAWEKSIELAFEVQAPIIALRNAHLAARTLTSNPDNRGAWNRAYSSIIRPLVEALDSAPMGEFMLELRLMEAQCLLLRHDYDEAFDCATSILPSAEMAPDTNRTMELYYLATVAGLEAGRIEKIVPLQRRRADLYISKEMYTQAADVYHHLAAILQQPDPYLSTAQDLLTRAKEEQNLQPGEWEVGLANGYLTAADLCPDMHDALQNCRKAAQAYEAGSSRPEAALCWLMAAMYQQHLELAEDGNPHPAALDKITHASQVYPSLLDIASDWDEEEAFNPEGPSSEDPRLDEMTRRVLQAYYNACLLYTSPSPRD